MSIQLVIFDLAGTTVAEGGAVYKCIRETLADNGLVLTERALLSVKGLEKREAFKYLIEAAGREEDLGAGLDAIVEDFGERIKNFYKQDKSIKEMPGATALFRQLRKSKVKVAVNTGFTREIADLVVERMGWVKSGLIDALVASDEVAKGRPHPDMIRKLMSLTDISDPKEVAKVGDTRADLLEGMNAGCGAVIAFAPSDQAVDDLGRCPRDFVISELSVVSKILDLKSH